MTGFGRGEAFSSGYRFAAEIKSVNHRFLNLSVRLPRAFAHLESRLTARCSGRCERGHLNVSIELEREGEGEGAGPRVNRAIVDRYLEIVGTLSGLDPVRDGVSADTLLGLAGVIDWESEQIQLDDAAFLAGAEPALDAALEALVESRCREGEALLEDFRARIEAIESERRKVADLVPLREERERERLRAKVRELLQDSDDGLDRRIEQEIVLLADRVDVSEELTRMRAHLDHFSAELAAGDGAVGRKLTFLLQELGREANTIGSKANDAEIAHRVVTLKEEIDRVREQIENVE